MKMKMKMKMQQTKIQYNNNKICQTLIATWLHMLGQQDNTL